MSTVRLLHNQIHLSLHELRGGTGRPLLLLHGLGEASPAEVPSAAADWPGPIHALDFTGHGTSDIPQGGGYSAEILLADADVALHHLGTATVVGSGLGAYVALLLCGAQPTLVRGAVLCDGPGLWGGSTGPTSNSFVIPTPSSTAPDRFALLELSRDLRPRDYATLFVRLALEHSGVDEPISVAAIVRPHWLAAVVDEVGVVERSLRESLAHYATV
ncbi:MAG: alpha/beta hydrolase [Actinomycetota bacterium]